MSLPGVIVNQQDGGLTIVAGSPSQTPVILGTCTAGTAATIYSAGDVSTLKSLLGNGKLVEHAAYVLDVAGGPVYVMPVNPSVVGALATPTHSGTGAGTLTASSAPDQTIVATVQTGGTLGTAKVTFQVGSGAVSQPVTLPANGIVAIAGTYCTATFAAGTYVLNDTYTFGTDGSVTHSGSGVVANPTQVSSPIDDYNVLVTITKSGANGVAQFTYSLDGGLVTSANILTPANGLYAIPNSGVYVTFGGTQTAADTFSFQVAAPSFSGSDLTACLTALETTYLSAAQYSLIFVPQYAGSASAAATEAASLQTACTTLQNSGVFVRAMGCVPTVGSVLINASAVQIDSADTDTVIETAFQSVVADHVSMAAGDCLLVSPLTGLSLRRNIGIAALARACQYEASRNIGDVSAGGVASVTKLYRDENATPGLDAARLITMRTFPNYPGLYFTDAHTLALSTSSFAALTNARVIDKACTVARATAMPLVQSKVPTSPKIAGAISEKAAQKLDAKMKSALNTSLVNTSPQDAVAASATTNRTHNILADGKLIITILVQPYAYAKTVQLDISLAATV